MLETLSNLDGTLIATLSLCVIVIPALAVYLTHTILNGQKHKKGQAKETENLRRDLLFMKNKLTLLEETLNPTVRNFANPAVTIEEWGGIHQYADSMFNKTKIDRCLVLRRFTIKDKEYVSVITQMRKDREFINYHHIAIDQHHIDLLTEVESKGWVFTVTKDLPECIIKTVQEHEGNEQCMWADIGIANFDGIESYIFVAFATPSKTPFTNEEKVTAELIKGQMKAALYR